MSEYLQTVADVYSEAADTPDSSLCCTNTPYLKLPDLHIPPIMLAMNYGCGTTVDPRDLRPEATILYVGVGGGLEALQFAYFTRRPAGVLAVDPVPAMRAKARANFLEAGRLNAWFRPEMVTILDGSALALPVPDASVSVIAQNCLFNVFIRDDLQLALSEAWRVLQPGGFFSTSDPIVPHALPESLVHDARLRAKCISGCQTFEAYLQAIVAAGFGRVEVRARFPYRWLSPAEYPELSKPILLESIELVAYKVPDSYDGPAIFTGRTATYIGSNTSWTDVTGIELSRGIPMPISDAAAERLAQQADLVLTGPTYQGKGGGCC